MCVTEFFSMIFVGNENVCLKEIRHCRRPIACLQPLVQHASHAAFRFLRSYHSTLIFGFSCTEAVHSTVAVWLENCG